VFVFNFNKSAARHCPSLPLIARLGTQKRRKKLV